MASLEPGEKIVEETKPMPLTKTPLFGLLVLTILLSILKTGARVYSGQYSLTRLVLEILMVLIFLYAGRDYRKKHYGISRYLLTDKRLILQGQIHEETLSSLLRGITYGSKKENAASIPYSTITGLKINKNPFFSILQITQNLAGHEAGPDTHREYAMVAIPNPEETMKKMLQFAPWAGPGKAIKK